jgi:hypothetical protein
MNQAVITFVDSAARASAITTPVEGMLTYLTGTDLYQFWNGSAWTNLIPSAGTPAVVQVKTTTMASTFSTSSTSLTDVTGLSVSITPTSASNRILVTTSFIAQSTNTVGEVMQFTFADGSNNNLIVPTSPGNRLGCFYSSSLINPAGGSSGAGTRTIAATLIHSPATTSAVTYKVRVRHSDSGGGGGTAFVNRSSDDADSVNRPRGVAIITAMEVAP